MSKLLLFVNYFLLVLSPFVSAGDGHNDSLQLVHVFFRHGSRTPEFKDTYPTDPYKIDTFLPMGWGQLTNQGKRRAFDLGQLLRQRYGYFLGDIYTPEIVEALSTDFDRTKMTALLVLAGLFPPSVSQIWHDDIPWIPIPYHFDKDKYDYTLRRPTKYCPTYLKELEEVMASEAVQRDIKTNKKLFQYVAKHTKKPINKLIDVFRIYQTLNSEEVMNLTLPEWTGSVYDDIKAIAARQCNYENYNAVLKRLNGGRMLAKVVQDMAAKSTGTLAPPNRKIFLYSGHENNVINILAALNLFEPHVPSYSAAVIIELHRSSKENMHAVKVFYVRNVDADPEEQKLEGCDVLCPLNRFIQITEPHVPVNYTAECHSHINLD